MEYGPVHLLVLLLSGTVEVDLEFRPLFPGI